MSLWKFSHCTAGSGKLFPCCGKWWAILQTRHVLQVIPGIDPDVFEHLAVVVWKGTRYLLIHCALNRLMHSIAHRSPSIETSLRGILLVRAYRSGGSNVIKPYQSRRIQAVSNRIHKIPPSFFISV